MFQKVSVKSSVLFLLITMLLVTGTSPLFKAPVVSDDLLILCTILARIVDGKDKLQLALEYSLLSSDSNHFLPIGGLLTFLQVLIISYLKNLPFDLIELWKIFRTLLQVFSVISFSIFIFRIFKRDHLDSNTFSFNAIYAYSALTFISFTQIHGPWLHDPVISFGLAGFGSAILSFIYLTGTITIADNQEVSALKYVFLISLGIIGILNSEIFVAALLSALILYFYLRSSPESSFTIKKIYKDLLVLLLPLLFFFVIQVIRLANPSVDAYSGTQIGQTGSLIPNLVMGIYSSLPLSYLEIATRYVGILEVNFFDAKYLLIVMALLVLIGYMSNSNKHNAKEKIKESRVQAGQITLVAFWVLSTLVVVISSKYQEVLSVRIGFVYLFYVFGSFSVIGIFLFWFHNSIKKLIKVVSILIIFVISIYTNSYNNELNNNMYEDLTVRYSNKIVSSLKINPPEVQRCHLLHILRESNLPPYYANNLLSTTTFLFYKKFNEPFCDL